MSTAPRPPRPRCLTGGWLLSHPLFWSPREDSGAGGPLARPLLLQSPCESRAPRVADFLKVPHKYPYTARQAVACSAARHRFSLSLSALSFGLLYYNLRHSFCSRSLHNRLIIHPFRSLATRLALPDVTKPPPLLLQAKPVLGPPLARQGGAWPRLKLGCILYPVGTPCFGGTEALPFPGDVRPSK